MANRTVERSAATVESSVVELPPQPPARLRLAGNEGALWLAASALMLFAGIVKAINLVIVMAYVLLGLWAMNWLLARRALRGISARRLPRPPMQARIASEWTLEIHDDVATAGNWVLREQTGDAVASWLVVRGGAGRVFRPRVLATFPRRGRFKIEPLLARLSYPFGLVGRTIQLLPADEIVVLPNSARVDGERLRAWLYRLWRGRDEERRKIRRLVDREAEIHGLRDYRPGDSPRRVHWKATARRNRLTVREYEDSSPPRLLVIVDPWLPAKPKKSDRDALEAVIALAAGVCREWRRGPGARLALVIAGPDASAVDGPPGATTTEVQLIALAIARGGEPGDVNGALGTLSRAARAAPALVLSSRRSSPVAAAARQALGTNVAFAHVGQPEAWYRFRIICAFPHPGDSLHHLFRPASVPERVHVSHPGIRRSTFDWT